ncbi:hypothetical protein MHYP_G00321690 [Metynnis hypsauchen]
MSKNRELFSITGVVLLRWTICRLGSRGGGRPPLRSLAQATGAGAEEGRSRPGLLITGPPQDIGPGAAIRRPGSHSAAHLSASVPTRPPQGRLTRAAPLWP